MAVSLALDLGGTKSLLGLVDSNGSVLYSERRPSLFPIQPETILAELASWVRELERKGKFDRIGIGMAGQLDPDQGLLMSTCLSDEALDIPIARLLAEQTGYPVIADNDAVTALIGERWKGAVQGQEHIVLLTIGTGLGGAAWEEGQVIRGKRGAALQVGHAVFQYDGLPCSCGNRGCTERYISGTGIHDAYLRLTGKSEKSEAIFQMYRNGHVEAGIVMNKFLHQCSSLIASMANMMNPQVFLLGGGVSESLSESEIAVMERNARGLALPANRDFTLVKAALNNEAGMIGAAYLALHETRHQHI